MAAPLSLFTQLPYLCLLKENREEVGARICLGLVMVDIIAGVATVAALALSYFSIISIPPTATYACISTAGTIVALYGLFFLIRATCRSGKPWIGA
jgi:hypothetical protein